MGTYPSCTSTFMLKDYDGVPMSIDERLDPATGLYTRHVFGLLFNHEIARTHRYPCPLVLLRIAMHQDIPPDENQPKCDKAFIGRLLANSVRHIDVLAQFGEDILVLLPATDELGGIVVGNRLLQRLQNDYPNHSGDKRPLDIHIGLAAHSGGPTASAEAILVQASEALEEARQRGSKALVNFREIATLGI